MSLCLNCHSSNTINVYSADNAVAYQNVLLKIFEEATNFPRRIINLLFCDDCTLLY